ncbi:hypothetical protein [Butyrivibrio sp. INlla16]|uniref:hypothetical protein n=1 Tax=Butyrivibrio sp. INlla16 TaxID=1520807 RepID=UPI00088F820B|nr:hypothetical protein [Butyrivibrio sp. INlla16]SDB68699.1 hypothetical protein SAMN02910263_04266 [Butyrivibrio sp. INlla16]
MNKSALKLYHELMKKGWIDRDDNSVLWGFVEDPEARDELDQMGCRMILYLEWMLHHFL